MSADGKEIDDTTFPPDFYNTFALGKYKAQESDDGSILVVEVPGFVMPERQIYTVPEITKMPKAELVALQDKLQAIIDQKT